MISMKKLLDTKLHNPLSGQMSFLRYLGPGLLVTVGFIDPGNWASNIAAGAQYGYELLWMVTLSTIMLILLQHNVAHLGIVTGDCLSEAAAKHLSGRASKTILYSAMTAGVATALAEILGGAIALQMLFHFPIKIGSIIILIAILIMLFTNTYRKLEKIIIGFVSIIGFSFIYELAVSKVDWMQAVHGSFVPSIPTGSIPIVMAVLGAVVMPHNLFLHSEIIQSRQWNKQEPDVIEKQLKYEFFDTLFSMLVGWAINSAMIIMAASAFYSSHVSVTELQQAQHLLSPLLGNGASIVFAIALLFSGISSSVTAGMAGGTMFAGMYKEPYDIKDSHTRIGVVGVLTLATAIIFLISNPFMGLVYSQIFLSMQLPVTIFLQIRLTSSEKVMGEHKNTQMTKYMLLITGAIVTILNILLLKAILFA